MSEAQEVFPDFFLPTESAVDKMLAAWDSLTFERKVEILGKCQKVGYSINLYKKILKKALSDSSAYVRYLAASIFPFQEDQGDELVKIKISEDVSELVSASLCEVDSGLNLLSFEEEDIEKFFRLTQSQRLAVVRITSRFANSFRKLLISVEKYIAKNFISKEDFYEVMVEYLSSTSFKSQYKNPENFSYDGYLEYSTEKSIENLWSTLDKIPVEFVPPLLKELPETHALDKCETIIESLTNIEDHVIKSLLFRKDICLKNLRKNIFFKDRDEQVRLAASSSFFNLSFEEFSILIPDLSNIEKENKGWKFRSDIDVKKLDFLYDLTLFSNSLNLVFYQSVYDILDIIPIEASFFAWENARQLYNRINILVEKRERKFSSREIVEARLYRLVNQLIPWGGKVSVGKVNGYFSSLEPRLGFLKKHIILDSTWDSFVSVQKVWFEHQRSIDLEKTLPKLSWLLPVEADILEENLEKNALKLQEVTFEKIDLIQKGLNKVYIIGVICMVFLILLIFIRL